MNKQELAYNEIKQLILKGELKPNIFLSERSISNRLGVSRTPVRAALYELCNDNLIVYYQGKGMMVAGIRMEDVHDVYQIRDALDVLAVKIVMETNNTAVIEEMNACVEKMKEACEREDWEEMVKQDMQFHDSYFRGVNNTRLRTILHSLHDQVDRFMNMTIYDVERLKASVAEHQEIMDAVNTGDVEGMSKALRKHLSIAKEYHMGRVSAISA